MLRKAAHALLAGGVLAIAGTFPYVLHLREALPGGEITPAFQRAFYVPWQLYLNLVARHGPLDATMIAWGGDGGLGTLVGNPGAAFLVAPFHGVGDPLLAYGLATLALGAASGAAGWAAGRSMAPSSPGRLAWIGAALAALPAWGWMQLGGGHWSAAWLAPGLGALAAARFSWRGTALAAAVLGMLTAPLPTAGALLAGAAFSGARARPWPRLEAAGLGLMALCGLLFPPMNSGVAMTPLPLAAVAWPGAGDALGLSFAGVAALALLARGGLGARVVAGLVAAALLVAVGPLVHGPDGALVRLDGFTLPVGPPGGWVGDHAREVLGAGLAAATVGLLAALGAPGRLATALIVAGLLAEPHLQAALGQPARLWTGAEMPVPAFLRALGERPLQGTILQIPLTGVSEGMVVFVPYHKQKVTGGPGAERTGPIRTALTDLAMQNPGVGALRNVDLATGQTPQGLGMTLSQAGIAHVVAYGDDAEQRVALTRLLGPPTTNEQWLVAWTLAASQSLQAGPPGGGPGGGPGAAGGAAMQGGGLQGGGVPGAFPGGVQGTMPGMQGGMPGGMQGMMPGGVGGGQPGRVPDRGGGMPGTMPGGANGMPGAGGLPSGMPGTLPSGVPGGGQAPTGMPGTLPSGVTGGGSDAIPPLVIPGMQGAGGQAGEKPPG